MTIIKKKFDNVMDGIDNMLNAAAYDYGLGGYTHRTKDDFRKDFMIKEGQKYIKIGRKSDHSSARMGQVWGFVVNTDSDKKFKKGDLLKALQDLMRLLVTPLVVMF